MKTKAAIAWKAGAPLTIEEVDLEGPRAGEVLVRLATGADVVVATDAGCLMNIGGCLHRRGSRLKFMHLAEILA